MMTNQDTVTSLINRIPDRKIDFDKLNKDLSPIIDILERDKLNWLNRVESLYDRHTLFFRRNKKGKNDKYHNFHVPITFAHLKAIASIIVHSQFTFKPMFIIKPIEELDKQRIENIRVLLQWTLANYLNNNKGAYQVIRDWIWDGCAYGWSVCKMSWNLVEQQVIHVVRDEEKLSQIYEQLMNISQTIDPNQDISELTSSISIPYKEVEEILKVIDCPMLVRLNPEEIFFPQKMNDASDLNEPQTVFHRMVLTKSDIKQKNKNGFFFKDAINELLDMAPDSDDYFQSIKNRRAVNRGFAKDESIEDGYVVDEIYHRLCLDDYSDDDKNYTSGVDTELVLWRHRKTGKFLKYTYLYRISPNGDRNLHKWDFITIPGLSHSIGIPELYKYGNDEIDAIHNGRMKAGLLANNPWGLIREGSSLSSDTFTQDAGDMYKVMDVHNDMKLMQFPFSPAWGFSEENMVKSYMSDISAINEASMGGVPAPMGSYGTVGGTGLLLGQKEIQLNVILKNWQSSCTKMYRSLLSLVQMNLPMDKKIRVMGENGLDSLDEKGNVRLITFKDRNEISGNVDFEILANSTNINSELMLQRFMQTMQILQNPLLINGEEAIVNKMNLYNMAKSYMEKAGMVDVNLYITKPQREEKAYTIEQEITACVQGIMPPIVLNDNHQEKIDKLKIFIDSLMYDVGKNMGEFSQMADTIFGEVIKKHEKMLQVIQAQVNNQQLYGVNIPSTPGAKIAGQINPQTQNAIVNSPIGQNTVNQPVNNNNINNNVNTTPQPI